jgi:hypothetical protein
MPADGIDLGLGGFSKVQKRGRSAYTESLDDAQPAGVRNRLERRPSDSCFYMADRS